MGDGMIGDSRICYTVSMNVKFENGAAILTGINGFQPADIFENGQAFRFTDVGGGVYEGVAYGRFLRVSETGGAAVLYPCAETDFEGIWRRYFDLARDYAALFAGCGDTALRQGIAFAPGLRVLNQQPFEMLISFIISANNNIRRIRGIVQAICEACGEPFMFEGKTCYAFPTPARLAGMGEEKLRACGCGYRAPYIRGAARAVAGGFDMEALRDTPYTQAKKQLQTLPGVGPKVADCILLFSLGHTCAFPADVWIWRVMRSAYGYAGREKDMAAFAREKFGEYAGLAQQYLFYWAREKGRGVLNSTF